MANVLLSNLAEVLTEQYTSKRVQDLTNKTAIIYSMIKKKPVKYVGGRAMTAYEPFKATGGAGMYWRSETGALPVASNTTEDRLEINANKAMSANIRISQTALQAGGKDALVNVISSVRDDIVDQIPANINRALFAGRTGELAKLSAAVSSSATINVNYTKLLAPGMRILTSSSNTTLAQTADQDISQGVTDPANDSYTVGTIDSATAFTLYNNANTASQTDSASNSRNLYRAGDIDSSANNTPDSFKKLLDNYALRATSSWDADGSATQTVHGVDRATVAGARLECKVKHNSNTNKVFDESVLEALIDEIEEVKIGATKVLITTNAIKRAIVQQFRDSQVVGGSKAMDLPFGHKALAYQYLNREIPIIVDRMAISNTILALDTDHIAFYVGKDFGWDDAGLDSGSIFTRALNSSARPIPVYEAFYTVFLNLGINRFDVQGIYRDITEA